MKLNGKSAFLTSVLCVILLLVILAEIGIFISGPSRKYEDDIAKPIASIKRNYKDLKNIHRDVFYYTTYIGEDEDTIVWFNEAGKIITSEKKSTLQIAKAKEIAQTQYGAKEIDVHIGYGYDNPVYVIQSEVGKLLLDYNTFKEVYYLKGEV
ncbi:MAG: hypothetical protein RR602_00830 [Longicatena sp.]